MKTTLQRAVCLLLSSALLLSLGACGKKKEKENSVRDVAEETSAETTQEMRKVESQEGKIGEQVTDQEVVATLKKAYVSDYTFTENDQEIGLTFFEFEIQNNSDEELVADMLSRTFGLSADGEAYAGISIRGPRFIYRQFGEEGGTFDDPIQPGETRDGWICMEVPADFQTLRITYFPRAGFLDWDEAYLYDIDRSDMEAAPQPVEAFQ